MMRNYPPSPRNYPQSPRPKRKAHLAFYQINILLGFIIGAYLSRIIPLYALVIVGAIQLIVIITTIFH